MLLYTINFTVWRTVDMCTYVLTYICSTCCMWVNVCFIINDDHEYNNNNWDLGNADLAHKFAGSYVIIAWSETLMAPARPHTHTCHSCSGVNLHAWVIYYKLYIHNIHSRIFQSGPMEVPHTHEVLWFRLVSVLYVHQLVTWSECLSIFAAAMIFGIPCTSTASHWFRQNLL